MDISAVEVVYEVYGVVDISDNACILIYGAGILPRFIAGQLLLL